MDDKLTLSEYIELYNKIIMKKNQTKKSTPKKQTPNKTKLTSKIINNAISGKGQFDGLTNWQIEDYLKKYKAFLGCYMSDELQKLPNLKRNTALICNLDKSGNSGTHWTAILRTDFDIYFYDSFGRKPQQNILSFMKRHGSEINCFYSDKKYQKPKSYNCGYFCIKFICDALGLGSAKQHPSEVILRLNQYPSNFNEKYVTNLKFESKLKQRGNTPKTEEEMIGEGIIIDKIKDILSFIQSLTTSDKKAFDENSRNLLKTYGKYKIIDITVGRRPLGEFYDKIIKNISLNKNEIEKYDTFFHLYMILTLENGKKLIYEKGNPSNRFKVRLRELNQNEDIENAELMNINLRREIGLLKFVKFGKKHMGENWSIYIPSGKEKGRGKGGNCQDFVIKQLESINIHLNTDQTNFIKQNVAKLFNTYLKAFGKIAVKIIQ